VQPNVLKMRIQPDEGISLMFGAKVPGPTTNVMPWRCTSATRRAFGKSSANGYERLLLDAMLGDGTLFAHRDGVEATWALMTPILEAWAKRRASLHRCSGCGCHGSRPGAHRDLRRKHA
jgi:glucose-6-phosphate 1-dehydrogenase